MRTISVFLLAAVCALAETKTMTLREAIDMALAQNPDVMIARLDQQKAREQVRIQRDAFQPKVYAGVGAAWTSGFPATVGGSGPSIAQFTTQMSLFDQSQRYLIAQARENVRGAEIDTVKQQEDVAYRVAALYLDAEGLQRSVEAASREVENLKRVAELVKTLVDEGRQLPIETTRANARLHQVSRHAELLTLDLTQAESSLALVLGMKADDLVQPAAVERTPFALPESEQAAIDRILESSPLLKRIESSAQSKELEIKSYRAQRLPKVNLIAQDEIYAKYYVQNYYPNFHYNSLQLGAGVSIPLIAGSAAKGYIGQAEAEIAKLRIEADRTRNRLASEMRRSFQEVKRAETNRDDAREDLNLAREQVSVTLAQVDEGRAAPSAVEQARAIEQEKWMAYYAAQHAVEVAKLNVLRDSGTLLATIK